MYLVPQQFLEASLLLPWATTRILLLSVTQLLIGPEQRNSCSPFCSVGARDVLLYLARLSVMYLLLHIQLQIYREAVPADASVQLIYTAVNLPHGHSYDNHACKLDNEKTKISN